MAEMHGGATGHASRYPAAMMRFNGSWLLLPVLAVGCAHEHIDREADRRIDEATTRVRSEIIQPSCDDGSFGARCGLVTQRVMTDDFRAKFRDRICQAKSSTECETAFQRMIVAELGRRYFAADGKAVETECGLSPFKCEDSVVYEKMLMVSHNRGLYRGFDVEEARIEADRRAKHAEAEGRDWRVVGEVGYALYPGTKCRAYPSVFGGLSNALCRR